MVETYSRRHYAELGIDDEFVQDNHSVRSAACISKRHLILKPS